MTAAALLLCAVAIAALLASTHRALRHLDPVRPAQRASIEAAWGALWLLPARCAIRAWLCVAATTVLAGGAAGLAGAAAACGWAP